MLEKTFYMNTVFEWLVAFGILALFIIAGKIVFWITTNILKKMATKSKTKLDDIVIDIIEEPIVFVIIISGIQVAFSTLNKTEAIGAFISSGVYMLIIFGVAWFLSRLLDAIVTNYLKPMAEKSSGTLDDQLLPIVHKILKGIIWVIAILMALNNAGYNIGALLAGLGIGGLAFAMAAKDTIANLFGGFTILMDKPFVVGDRVGTNGFDGVVEDIGLRSSKIRTLQGRLVTISNADISNGAIENITSEPSRKISMSLGLTYDTDEKKIQKAIDILENIIKNTDGVEDEPTVWFDSFGDFSLNISFIYLIKNGENISKIKNNINLSILSQFNKNKIDMAYPTQTVLIDK
ncbi:MAG: mechanosensitive ion channel family protein [Epsilonproteobacteria bacterium]|nr:MAG: mechanosensitive ion channel family protein [Campylobacterota bacterium]